MPIGTAILSELRDRLELILSINTGDAYIDSTSELQDINEAYQATAYRYDWPSLLIRRGLRILANQRKYATPSNFRKFHSLFVKGVPFRETELHNVLKTRQAYGVDLATDELILNILESSNGTEFTLTNAESAGQTVTIELNSISGLSSGDEVFFPDDGNPENTFVAATDSAAVTITARLDTSKSASAVMYRGLDNIMFNYYRTITLLSGATNTTLLPPAVDFIMLHKAASLAFSRLELFKEAEDHERIWQRDLAEAWLAHDKSSSGAVTTFSV